MKEKIGEEMDDQTLEGLALRKEKAFKKTYYEYFKLVYYISYSILTNREDAEEVTQDTFVKMYKNIGMYKKDISFKAWLGTIARNEALNTLKRRKEDVHDENLINSQKAYDSNKDELILTFNHLLAPKDAQIMTLRFVYDFTFEEIASTLKISVGTVQGKYYSSLDKLKGYFKGGKL